MTLWEIDNEIRLFLDKLVSSVDEETGELIDIDPSELEALTAAREAKWESIALYYKNLTADATAIKTEEDNLKARRESLEKKAERLKNLLSASMLAAGEPKLGTSKCAVSFKASDRLVIDDLSKIGEEYTKVEIKPNKADIKRAIKAGEKIEGAHIEACQNIQIK